jgi:hypothetical protein
VEKKANERRREFEGKERRRNMERSNVDVKLGRREMTSDVAGDEITRAGRKNTTNTGTHTHTHTLTHIQRERNQI